MPPQRARGVGHIGKVRARTIRVVFAGKLLEKLILQALILLSLHSIKAFVGTCDRSASIGTCQSTSPISLRCSLRFHLLLLCRLETTPRSRPCDSDESDEATQAREVNWAKIGRQNEKKKNLTYLSAPSPGTWDWLYNYENILHACTYNSDCLCCKIAQKVNTPNTKFT